MIFHSSITASEPERVARVIAELWRGTARPAPGGMFDGKCHVAFALDDRGTQIEVLPHDFAFVLRSKLDEVKEFDPERRKNVGLTATHYAIASPLTEGEVHAIAEREGWECGTYHREVPGGGYGVIEVWLENRQMIEVLTEEMQRQYARTMARVRSRFQPS